MPRVLPQRGLGMNKQPVNDTERATADLWEVVKLVGVAVGMALVIWWVFLR